MADRILSSGRVSPNLLTGIFSEGSSQSYGTPNSKTKKRVRFRHESGSSDDQFIESSLVHSGILETASQTEGYFEKYGTEFLSAYDSACDAVKMVRRSVGSSVTLQSIMSFLRESDLKPKTGYTYASGLGYDIHGQPNPPMPNMSRYSLDYYGRSSSTGYSQASSKSQYSSSSERQFSSSQQTDSERTSRKNVTENMLSRRTGEDLGSGSLNESLTLGTVDVTDYNNPPLAEARSAFRDYLSKMYRNAKRTITTTTVTNGQQYRGQRDDVGEDHDSIPNGRTSPQSRPGNDMYYNTNNSRDYYSSSASNALRSSSRNSSRLEQSRLHSSNSGIHSNGNGHVRSARSYGDSSFRTTDSLFETITRRFIDIVTKTTTTISETLDLRHDDGRSRSPWSLCWCWFPLLLLFLLPFLFGLWSLAGRSSETAGVMGPSAVIYSFYRGWFGADNRDAGLVYNLNSTNITREELDNIIMCRLKEFQVPKNCCHDIDFIKSQIALILHRLDDVDQDQVQRKRWEAEREYSEEQNRLSMDELRLLLVQVEQAVSIRHEVVPKFVQRRENFTLEDIRLMITTMIKRYDEDKTGEPDHALESAGATVISTRCTQEYKWGYAQYSLFGIPLWSWTTTPRLAIQADMRPGQCWAFKGDQGYLVVKLAGAVRPTSFTLEHLPKNLSPTGKIDSAPRNFEVYGLASEQGPGYILGKYEYLDNDQSLQNFQIQTKLEPEETFPFVELRITSNHGHPEYTCLYRFRVHGQLIRSMA